MAANASGFIRNRSVNLSVTVNTQINIDPKLIMRTDPTRAAPAREVGPGHSSVLGGEEEGDIEVQLGPLTVDTGDKFAK